MCVCVALVLSAAMLFFDRRFVVAAVTAVKTQRIGASEMRLLRSFALIVLLYYSKKGALQ